MSLSTDSQLTTPSEISTGNDVERLRIKLSDLLRQMREIEIDHDGKIYRLRLTQSNKLILTA